MSHYHTLQSIREIHVEVTNRCNAACPMCARNHFGGKQKSFELTEWKAEDGDKVFSPSLTNLRNVLFCGTHGDPAAAQHTLSFVESVKKHKSATIEFYSNASLRPKTWWNDLGRLLQRKITDNYYRNSDLGIFSIDGLKETNHLYRRQTNFDKIMENAEAFISAGGIARWDFIVFKHNEHQVEEARSLAKKMGFKQFRIRKTSRFTYSPDGPEKHRVQNREGKVEYYLEPPTLEQYRNPNEKKILDAANAGFFDHLAKVEISCLNKTQFQRLYVNAFLQIHPCCFIANDIYPSKNPLVNDTVEKVFRKFDQDFNSLNHFSWEQVLKHQLFSRDLVESWNKKVEDGRLLRCARTCGKGYSPILSQSSDSKIGEDSRQLRKGILERFFSKFV